MNENYAVINGKRIELTDEQVKALGIKRKNPFERVTTGDEYYTITGYDNINEFTEDGDGADQNLYDAGNYFNDEQFAKQVALHQLLYRKLLKFSYENNYTDVEWNGHNDHWRIYYNPDGLNYCVAGFGSHKFDGVWFSSERGAERAIEEVVEPFVKNIPTLCGERSITNVLSDELDIYLFYNNYYLSYLHKRSVRHCCISISYNCSCSKDFRICLCNVEVR